MVASGREWRDLVDADVGRFGTVQLPETGEVFHAMRGWGGCMTQKTFRSREAAESRAAELMEREPGARWQAVPWGCGPREQPRYWVVRRDFQEGGPCAVCARVYGDQVGCDAGKPVGSPHRKGVA